MLVQFTVHPHIGRPRSAVCPINNKAELDAQVEFYLRDNTGNTKSVTYKEYVPHGQSE